MADRPNFGEWIIPVIVAGFAVVTAWAKHKMALTLRGAILAYAVLFLAAIGAYLWRRHEYRLAKSHEDADKEQDRLATITREDARDARLRKEREDERRADREGDAARRAEDREALETRKAEDEFTKAATELTSEQRTILLVLVRNTDGLPPSFPMAQEIKAAAPLLVFYDQEQQRVRLREEYVAPAFQWSLRQDEEAARLHRIAQDEEQFQNAIAKLKEPTKD